MSQTLFAPTSGVASTSSAPHIATAASYHPLPRPQPLPPLVRVDTQAIKQELHDALGENGLAYWKAVNGYLVGQLSKRELEGMVKGWLKGDRLQLHNKLLISLLHNASTPSSAPSSSLLARKRKRVPHHDPDFDTDEVLIEPKLRISHWVGSLTNRDRGRLRRGMAQGVKAVEDEAAGAGDGKAEGEAAPEEQEAARRKLSTYTPNLTLPSITLPDRSLPSSLQISARVQAFAAANDLRMPDDPDDLAEFFSVGLDDHVSGILQGVVHLTGRERSGTESIQIPLGRRLSVDSQSDDGQDDGRRHASPAMPEPGIETLHHMFNLNAGAHPHPSPALYQLRTGHTLGQLNAHKPTPKRTLPNHLEITSRPVSPTVPNGISHIAKLQNGTAHPQPTPPPSPAPGPIVPMTHPSSAHFTSLSGTPSGSAQLSHRGEAVQRNLLESGLLKIEAPEKGEEEAGGKGKKKKHGLHWKYEDPAFILKDILG